MNLRERARGETCDIRAPTHCNGNAETTVLAHVRMIGISAMSMKCPDWFGAHACSGCHDYVDGRVPSPDSYEKRRLLHLEGMARTQHKLLTRGIGPDLLAEAEKLTTENT